MGSRDAGPPAWANRSRAAPRVHCGPITSERYNVTVDPAEPNNPHSIALRMVGGHQRVLELGCSGGHVTEHLTAAGNKVVGVEFDPDDAARARAFAERVHVLDLDVDRVSSVETGPFDVAVMGDVLEHVRRPDQVLSDVVPLLADDGRLVVSVPNVAHIDIRLHLLEGRWEYQPDGLLDETHLRWFTRASLRALLAEAGFVARQLEPVVRPRGASLLPSTPGLVGTEIVRFVESDPDAEVYQWVVEAVRTDRYDGADALAPIEHRWPDLDAERHDLTARTDALVAERDALRNEVDAWRRSRVVRATAPIRSVLSRLHR